MLSRFLTVAAMAAVFAGCGGDGSVQYDAGASDASVVGARNLSVTMQPATTLGIKAVTPIGVRLVDAFGEPVVAERVIFGIDGNGYGATLSSLERSTDEDGRAEVLVTTGASGGPLAVRVSALYATPVRVEMSVSATAVGTFEVVAVYDGSRTLGAIELAFVAGGDCDDVRTRGATGEPAALLDAGTTEGSFDSLPAGSLFAVVAHARALVDGGYAADGCIDGVVVPLGGQADVTITLEDRPVIGADPLEGAITIEGEVFASWLAGTGHDAMYAHITAEGGDAEMLFGVLVSALALSDPPGATAVVDAATPAAISALDDALLIADAGPTAVASTMRAAFESVAPDMVLTGTLGFSLADPPVFTVTGVSFAVEGEEPFVLYDVAGIIGTEITLPGAFAIGYAGYHVLDATLPFGSDDAGTLLYDVLEAFYASGLGAYYANRLGCSELFASPALSGLPHCTAAACREDVCDRVYDALEDAAQAAYVGALDSRATLSFSGVIELLDTDEDDVADTAVSNGADVVWSADGSADVLESTFSLMATAVP